MTGTFEIFMSVKDHQFTLTTLMYDYLFQILMQGSLYLIEELIAFLSRVLLL